MKKKVLAVLLAVCMIMSSGVLMASAASFAKGTYVEKINDSGNLLVDNLKAISSAAFNINVTVTPKTGISLNSGTTTVTAGNVDDILSFKSSSATLTYASNLASYYDVSGTISGNNVTVNFTPKAANTLNDVYSVDTAIDDSVTDASTYVSSVSAVKYILSDTTVAATVSKWVTKLASVSMGVRFFGSTYKNLVASEIAVVTASVDRKSGATTKVTSSVTDKIEDLMPGDEVILKASLKDPDKQKDFYGFYCWVDGSGDVVSTSDTIKIVMDGTSVAYYATFVELKSRVTIDYSSNGNGKVLYNEAREIFNGDAQISVMCDKPATFTFVPDEGYEVAKVVVDGKNVASFSAINFSSIKSILASLGVLVNATNKETYCYTFTAEQLAEANGNHSIEVTFQKVTPLETPSGKDLPIVDAEGITLANAEDVAAEAKAEKDAKGTTVPAEDGAAANGGAAATGIVNPATGSASAIAVFAVLSVAAGAAFVTAKKKND